MPYHAPDESGQSELQPPEDEISLIDLVVVVLRYRRVIIGCTLAGVLLAIAGYFFYPPFQYRRAAQTTPAEASVTLRISPAIELFEVEAAIEDVLLTPPVLLDALRAAGYTRLGGAEIGTGTGTPRALAVVQRRLVDRRTARGTPIAEHQQVLRVNADGPFITLTARGPQPEQVEGFLRALSASIDHELRAFLLPDAASAIEGQTALLAVDNPSPGVIAAIQEGTRRYNAALRVMDSAVPLVTERASVQIISGQPGIEELRERFVVRAVILVFAAFFFALFLAFVLNYIDRVKTDPVAMQKLRNATRSPARTGKTGAGTP